MVIQHAATHYPPAVAPNRLRPDNASEWTREFAAPFVRNAVNRAVAEATPGIEGRLARDPSAYVELLTVSHMVAQEAEAALGRQVLAAHQAGLTWEMIGIALGLDAVTAQQRFTVGFHGQLQPPVSPDYLSLPPVGTLEVTDPGLFAGQEIECLNRAGKYGWHAVDLISNRWTLAFDNRQWQHIITSDPYNPPYGDGWIPTVTLKRKTYWSRPTNLPICPGNPPIKAFISDRKLQRMLFNQK